MTRERSTDENREEALQKASAELESLIGIPGVKKQVRELMARIEVQQRRRAHGFRENAQTLHFVFKGNPGTGKTTVARILSGIFYGFGVLKTATFVEADKSNLVAEWLGQTPTKTNKLIDSALDGVLFIDEAYSLTGANELADAYGKEAIDTLLKRMEDDRDRLIVIVAGYPAPMEKFIKSNPGLESRFTRFIHFEDYGVADLCRIFERFCRESDYTLTPAARAHAFLLFSAAFSTRDERFGNARSVRNQFERAVGLHSSRLSPLGSAVSKEALATFESADIPLEEFTGLDAGAIDLSASRWEAERPTCGAEITEGVSVLGEPYAHLCGTPFTFPWWNPVPESFSGFPAELLAPTLAGDRIGIVETYADKAAPGGRGFPRPSSPKDPESPPTTSPKAPSGRKAAAGNKGRSRGKRILKDSDSIWCSPEDVATARTELELIAQRTQKVIEFKRRWEAALAKGDYEKAIGDCTEAIRLDPNNAGAYFNRGHAKGELKDYEGEITDCTEAIRLDPNYAPAYNNRGFPKAELFDYKGAIADYDEAIRLDPNNDWAYARRGDAKCGGFGEEFLRDHTGAVADYTEAIRLKPNAGWAYRCRGVAKWNLGDCEGAIADYDEAIRLEPNNARAFYDRGTAKRNGDDHDIESAIADFTEAIRLWPRWPDCYISAHK